MIIEKVSRNYDLLQKTFHDDDYKIDKAKFRYICNENELKELFRGIDTTDWKIAREKFISNQADLGFNWSMQGGPIYLKDISLTYECGSDLADSLFKKKIKQGTLDENFPPNVKLIKDDTRIFFHMESFLQGFKEKTHNSKQYFFKTCSKNIFEISGNIYDYKKALENSENKKLASKPEEALGKQIQNDIKITLNLMYLMDMHNNRLGAKYKNVDFAGLSIDDMITDQKISLVSIELKKDNSITSISESISQAINYKLFSTQVYIAIPNFSYSSFHEKDRLDEFLGQCKANGIGVVSIEFQDNQVIHDSIDIVIAAREEKLCSTELLQKVLKNFDINYCPLCKKLVNESKNECGWSHPISEQCMRKEIEKLAEASIKPAGEP